MSEEIELLLVLGAIYLVDCMVWARGDTIVFFRRFGRQWRHSSTEPLFVALQRGFFFGNPLPPLGTVLVAPHWPVSLSREGVCGYVMPTAAVGPRSVSSHRFFAWNDCHKIAADGKSLTVDGIVLAKLDSPIRADAVASLMRKIAESPLEKRETLIAGALREQLDTRVILERLARLERAEFPARIITNLLVLHLFVAVPATIINVGLAMTWPTLLAVTAVLWLAAVVMFVMAHRSLFPSRLDLCASQSLGMLLLLPSAARACDKLWRDALADFHPLGIAYVLSGRDSFPELARHALLDERFPLPVEESAALNDEGRACAEQFAKTWRAGVHEFLTEKRADLSALLSEPTRESVDCLAYCPRCLSQFVLREGRCDPCGGLALTPFIGMPHPSPTP